MIKYAMVLLNRVIDIVESDLIPEYPPDEHGNPVFTIKCDDSVKVGMIYNDITKEFEEYIYTEYKEAPSESLIIMEAIADQYEQGLANRLDDMEVQATIYETILEMGGNV